ncbi:MAG: hypothetical protein A2275_15675 [Bacteroidetes bacterium RIFOXYA12_FULL_35_11]|nr:MAG: hypothetical protein A2X01_21645 [Bacteroidetes bacterium GWF2_35_48]OFY79604.1 MAG: hypothetical protein A2275_15675 [Bacteroidetes bacterium RIFOXYA12_FULL_35_11]OFY99404.1 MAG: hypothetical protein A2491_21565 [Bacteroidetes bacterium RIFOXYC12_FULL_35_7]HBX50555.1 formylglycine-generating enzyme family protein [Bacteroidales bacterium]
MNFIVKHFFLFFLGSAYLNLIQAQTSFEKNLVLVEGGTFSMGQTDPDISCKGCTKDEQPVHKVTLKSFYIGKYEVTQKEWKEIMGTDPNFEDDCDDCPIEGVSWKDVQAFLVKLNEKTGKKFRLPTEAEWEYAARGGNKSQGYIYSGSNNHLEVAWCSLKKDKRIHPVGQKKSNELGIYDMSGNVWEWCQDYYAADYYSKSPAENPPGSATGKDRILRGGSWYGQSFDVRVCTRYRFFPTFQTNANGFRIALSAQ